MVDSLAVKNFVDKVRLAQDNKAKDIRLTMEEATALVAWIAMINANLESLKNIENKLDNLTKNVVSSSNTGIDGGKF